MRTNFILIWLMLLLSVHALRQEPKSAEQFNNRGLQRMAQADADGAIADFTATLKSPGQQPLVAAIITIARIRA